MDDAINPVGLARPAVERQFTDIEAARIIAYFLLRAAEKVGVSPDATGWDGLPQRILAAAQGGGKLPPDDYRLVWQLASALR